MLELDKYVHQLDIHRMDKEGLYNYITEYTFRLKIFKN